MADLNHDLPDGMVEWIAEAGGGEITRLHRHVARREAWIVDVTRPDGSVLEGFLRLQRDDGGVDPRRLERETRITQALGETDIPVTEVYAWNPDLCATLFSRDPGRSDLDKVEDLKQQRAVMEDFMRVVARMHALDLDALDLDDIMEPRPKNAEEAALGEVDVIVRQWKHFLDDYTDPLTVYGLDWLRRFVPKEVARVSLVQGDTGPVNFMFQGDQVSSIIDWEIGHWGDPMEDLGNIVVREMWNPSGGLTGLFKLYEEESGVPYSRFAAQYYQRASKRAGHGADSLCLPECASARVPRLVPVLPLRRRSNDLRNVGDGHGCQGREAFDARRRRCGDVLANAAIYAQENDVAPATRDAFSTQRAKDVRILIECMDRKRRYGPAIDQIECEEMAALLGSSLLRLKKAIGQLSEAIRAHSLEDAPLIQYLTRKSYRDEWLYQPAVNIYPNRFWADLD